MQLYKYARLFDPVKVSELNPCSSYIDHLKAFPFLHDKLEDLRKELPSYLAKADSLSSTWWQQYVNELPHWSVACKLLLPSSAAAERVFSLMSNSLSDKQTGNLEETIETSVTLHYNSRKR